MSYGWHPHIHTESHGIVLLSQLFIKGKRRQTLTRPQASDRPSLECGSQGFKLGCR